MYASHSQLTHDHPEKTDALYDKLDDTYKKLRKESDNVIIAGDFNACVGKKKDDEKLEVSFSTTLPVLVYHFKGDLFF